ncbi:MAG TPA: dihydroxy-acid dehydratase, partial [Acidimicrobiia bacterium]|nr:dihydroxy-acid dehydratase [Acidimicrobiia bacterium]
VIDVPNRKLDVLVDEATMAKRKEGWKPKDPRYTSGFLAKYAKLVQSASRGAITNLG